jgi:large-conductance mechanosensitive channel
MNRLKRKEEEKPKEEKHPTQVELLVEIRDLLKK